MSANMVRFCRLGALSCSLLLLGSIPAIGGEVVSVEQSPAYARNVARVSLGARVELFRQNNPVGTLQLASASEDSIAQAALISDHPTTAYTLAEGKTDLVLSLSKIENIDLISFLNSSATGSVTIAISNTKLAAGSPQWHEIAKQSLTATATKIKVGPAEAKYIKFTFNVTQTGRIADLGVYAATNLTLANANMAGAGAGTVDGKDAKDMGDSKEAKEVAEGPPEEGPPPNIPDPPPFVFIPEVSP